MPFRVPTNFQYLAVRSHDPTDEELAEYERWLTLEYRTVLNVIRERKRSAPRKKPAAKPAPKPAEE